MNLLKASLALALILVMAGCAGTTSPTTPPTPAVPSHSNQISAFDGIAYDTLITVQGSLARAKTLVPTYPQFKGELNDVIAAYNSAIAAYKVYHSAGSGAADITVLQSQINALVSSVSKLLADMGAKL